MPPPDPAGSEAPPRGPARPNRWLRLLVRLAIIGVIGNVLALAPLPLVDDWLPTRNVAVAVFTVVAAGKALFDTLFFDRYQP